MIPLLLHNYDHCVYTCSFVMITDRSILIITWHSDLLHSRWPVGSGDLLGVGLATWEDRVDYDLCMGLHRSFLPAPDRAW